MSGELRYVDDFARELRALVRAYLVTLSPGAPTDIRHIRLEASGAGLSVTYSEDGADARPGLQVALTGIGEDAPEGTRR